MERGSSAIAVTLLILLPIPPSHLLDDISQGEIIIETESVWTTFEWNSLIKQGIQPIRQLSETEMLAWGPLNGDIKPAKITECIAPILAHASTEIASSGIIGK